MHWRNRILWLGVPWAVLGVAFVVNLIIGYFLGKDAPYYTGALISIFIVVSIFGGVMLMQTFSFAIGLSVRRKDFFIGTTSFGTLLCAMFSILLTILTFVEQGTDGWGVHMHFFSLPWLSDGWMVSRLWVFFVGMLHLYFVGQIYSACSCRFGRRGVFLLSFCLFIAVFICGFLFTYYDLWSQIADFFRSLSAPELFSWLALPVPVYAVLCYLMLRKSTV